MSAFVNPNHWYLAKVTASTTDLPRNRRVIVLIVLICIIPFVIAWFLAKNPQLVEGRKKSNYGHLITPPRPFDYNEFFQNPITPAETLPEIKGRWVLLQVSASASCEEVCQETAYKTRQLRLMLNKELSRVRRLLLLPGKGEARSIRDLVGVDQTLLIAGLPDALRQRLQEAVGAPLTEGMMVIMDPFANIMMWYEPGFDPYGALRDLQRLLKVSQIG